MCHAPGLANSNPYPPTWNGAASGSTVNKGIYTIVPGSPADHTNYTTAQCTQAGCHAAPGSTTTPPTTTTTTPPTTTTGTTTTTTTATSGVTNVDINEGFFSPATASVKVGGTITFNNNRETTTHLICDALEVDVTIARNGTTSYTFAAAGKYTFTTEEGTTCVVTVA
jgi:plastocyanin